MSLFWSTLAVVVVVGGVLGLRRVREGDGLSDEDIAAIERGRAVEGREPLDLDEIAEAERRHREQTWDLDEPDVW